MPGGGYFILATLSSVLKAETMGEITMVEHGMKWLLPNTGTGPADRKLPYLNHIHCEVIGVKERQSGEEVVLNIGWRCWCLRFHRSINC